MTFILSSFENEIYSQYNPNPERGKKKISSPGNELLIIFGDFDYEGLSILRGASYAFG